MTSTAPVILADADNTLWDTDAVYAAAQLNLLVDVEVLTGEAAPANRLEFLRGYDQALASADHRGFRYPTELLVRALALGLRGLRPREAAAAAPTGAGRALAAEQVERVSEDFRAAVKRMPDLLPTVREGLVLAASAGAEVWVLTENAADLQRSRVAGHELSSLIRGVAEVTKTSEQFARQRRRFAGRDVVVVGDQPDRDAAPARAAGCLAVLVPSRFRPQSVATFRDGDHVAEDFRAAIVWALGEGARADVGLRAAASPA